MMNSSTHKDLYEALQSVNARLDAVGEQMLIGLVETIRTSLRQEQAALGGSMPMGTLGQTEATLKIWIEVDAAEEDELVCVGCLTGRGTHSVEPGACRRAQPAEQAARPHPTPAYVRKRLIL